MMGVPAPHVPVNAVTEIVSPEATVTERSSPNPQVALRLVAALTGDGDATAIPNDNTTAETNQTRRWQEFNMAALILIVVAVCQVLRWNSLIANSPDTAAV